VLIADAAPLRNKQRIGFRRPPAFVVTQYRFLLVAFSYTLTTILKGASSMNPLVPPGTMDPFSDFLNHSQQLSYLLELSVRGISSIRAMPQVIRAIAKAEDDHAHPTGKRLTDLANATKLAELAQQEVDAGFPLLHEQAAISMWSSLEATVKECLAQWITREPSAKQKDKLKKIKISYADYESMAPDDRAYYIVDMLEREVAAPFKQGVTRFEVLLQIFGLDGPVEENVGKTIFELNAVRNVLVHRRGIADRRFVEACPWLGLTVGERLKVDRVAIARYGEATSKYIYTLILRVGDFYGADLRPDDPTDAPIIPIPES
jgi:hypothetical protein